MKNSLFVDTGAFYGRYVTADDHHSEALFLWHKIKEKKFFSFTSNLVVAELVTLLAYRFGSSAALKAAREIYSSHTIEILHVGLKTELNALEWLEKFSDQKLSMTDAVSFALMEEKKQKMVFTFDHHFEIAGFQRFELGHPAPTIKNNVAKKTL